MDRAQRYREIYAENQLRGITLTNEQILVQIEREEAQSNQEQNYFDAVYSQAEAELKTKLYDGFLQLTQLQDNWQEYEKEVRKVVDKEFQAAYKNMANRVRENLRAEWETEKFAQSKLLQLLDKELQNDETFIPRVRVLLENVLNQKKAFQKRGL